MKKMQNSPWEGIHLQWFGKDDSTGQVVDDPANSGQVGEEQEPFLSLSVPGENVDEVLNFKNKEEVAKAFIENRMRRSNYSKKTAETAELRKAADADKQMYAQMLADTNRRKAELDKQAEKYNNYEQQLQMNPALRRELAKLKGQPHSGEDIRDMIKSYVEEQYGSTIEEINNWKRDQMMADQKTQTYNSLKKEFEDFDGNAVDSVYEKLASGDVVDLVRMLYYANKGMSIDPMQVKQQVVDGIQKKQNAKLPSAEGSSSSVPDKKVPGSIEEAYEALKLDF